MVDAKPLCCFCSSGLPCSLLHCCILFFCFLHCNFMLWTRLTVTLQIAAAKKLCKTEAIPSVSLFANCASTKGNKVWIAAKRKPQIAVQCSFKGTVSPSWTTEHAWRQQQMAKGHGDRHHNLFFCSIVPENWNQWKRGRMGLSHNLLTSFCRWSVFLELWWMFVCMQLHLNPDQTLTKGVIWKCSQTSCLFKVMGQTVWNICCDFGSESKNGLLEKDEAEHWATMWSLLVLQQTDSHAMPGMGPVLQRFVQSGHFGLHQHIATLCHSDTVCGKFPIERSLVWTSMVTTEWVWTTGDTIRSLPKATSHMLCHSQVSKSHDCQCSQNGRFRWPTVAMTTWSGQLRNTIQCIAVAMCSNWHRTWKSSHNETVCFTGQFSHDSHEGSTHKCSTTCPSHWPLTINCHVSLRLNCCLRNWHPHESWGGESREEHTCGLQTVQLSLQHGCGQSNCAAGAMWKHALQSPHTFHPWTCFRSGHFETWSCAHWPINKFFNHNAWGECSAQIHVPGFGPVQWPFVQSGCFGSVQSHVAMQVANHKIVVELKWLRHWQHCQLNWKLWTTWWCKSELETLIAIHAWWDDLSNKRWTGCPTIVLFVITRSTHACGQPVPLKDTSRKHTVVKEPAVHQI